MTNTGYITIEMVRKQMQDRTPADNSIDCDLFFSDDDILYAMEATAAEYNGISPLGVESVSGTCLPAYPYLFMLGVTANLYDIAMNKISRNLITWNAGGTTVDVEGKRFEVFKAMQEQARQRFMAAARDRKAEINRNLAYSSF